MTVHFIGAGPGAADLITLRGRDLIARSPVCLYAGSLVPAALLDYCPPGARIVDTAPMILDEIVAEIAGGARRRGLDVARLHSGDLSIWSALGEQTRRLRALGIPTTSRRACPPSPPPPRRCGRELTLPEVAQSLVLTRTAGRASAMPERETLAAFAATGATLAIHLSIHALDTRRRRADAVLRRRLPGRGRVPRELAGRAGRCAARSATSSPRFADDADGAHGADPGRRSARGARISARARSTIPTIAAAIGGADVKRAQARGRQQRAVAVEHGDLQPLARRRRAPAPPSPRRRRRRGGARSKPAAAARSNACLAVLARRYRAASSAGVARPGRRASRDRPRRAANAGRADPGRACSSWPTPPAMVTSRRRDGRADI